MRREATWKIGAAMLAVAVACALAAMAGPKKLPPAKPLDLNRATLEQLEQLPGIGPSTAKAIVRFREKSGPFQRVDDLLAIHGLSPSRLRKIRPYVFVRPARQQPPAKSSRP